MREKFIPLRNDNSRFNSAKDRAGSLVRKGALGALTTIAVLTAPGCSADASSPTEVSNPITTITTSESTTSLENYGEALSQLRRTNIEAFDSLAQKRPHDITTINGTGSEVNLEFRQINFSTGEAAYKMTYVYNTESQLPEEITASVVSRESTKTAVIGTSGVVIRNDSPFQEPTITYAKDESDPNWQDDFAAVQDLVNRVINAA